MIRQHKEVLGENSVPVLNYPPHMPHPLTRIEPRLPGLETGEKSSDISRPGEDISQSGAA